ncbi:hypothetical protein NIES4073_72460 [Kalymmatonema gypsitolerans NIES-4073]|jgi:hypothetical protein|nr:hypothetical protein NIES4073_72460 [Scytonema sp. NIES-4073]
MIISDLEFLEVVSETSSVVGGYAAFDADAFASAFAAGQNAVTDTFTSGFANRTTTSASAGSSSSSAGFASLTTPVPANLSIAS